jgi:P27 family predicted phage terminase small subunit
MLLDIGARGRVFGNHFGGTKMGSRGPIGRDASPPPPPLTEPVEPPQWLPSAAAALWREVEPALRQSGRLRSEHTEVLAQWACTVVELRALTLTISKEGSTAPGRLGMAPTAAHRAACKLREVMLSLGKAVGLDPASAARLSTMAQPVSETPSALALWRARHPA